MTAYVTATLQNLLLRRRALPTATGRPAQVRPSRSVQVRDAAETLPMLYRSEGFAEDLPVSPLPH